MINLLLIAHTYKISYVYFLNPADNRRNFFEKRNYSFVNLTVATSADGIVDYVVAIAQGLKMRNPHLIYKINTFYDRLQVIIKSYNFFLAFLVLWLQSKHASAVSWRTFRRHSKQKLAMTSAAAQSSSSHLICKPSSISRKSFSKLSTPQ